MNCAPSLIWRCICELVFSFFLYFFVERIGISIHKLRDTKVNDAQNMQSKFGFIFNLISTQQVFNRRWEWNFANTKTFCLNRSYGVVQFRCILKNSKGIVINCDKGNWIICSNLHVVSSLQSINFFLISSCTWCIAVLVWKVSSKRIWN